jgi:hypothetical protein
MRTETEAYDDAVPALTPAQQRILSKAREGPHTYNGRAAKAIKALEIAGLVTVDWDADLDHTKGRLRWHITVTITELGIHEQFHQLTNLAGLPSSHQEQSSG